MGLTNGIPLINGVTYGWGDITVLIGGVPVMGITAIDYSDTQDVVNHYGAARHPVSRGKGRITPAAKITLFMEEVVALQSKALNGRLQDLAPFDVTVSYIPDNGLVITDKIRNCQFKANTRKWKEGETKHEVDLDLLPSHIEWGKLGGK